MARRLNFLELHGYKTFANHTPFDLSARITAVVGPNGSGKSNIADCIRWVLGEQSFSLLRGRKTEDMIFSGSEARPRLGMASATITFNNEDGWMPIDFSEVAVTRRAYRDGDNEYLINGQRVRLKDVSELLYPSGLAERTYTVIGQGLVDAVLSLRADERRRLFEEAAGIGLYRARREEAIRRLDSTRRNLDRVQDILLELTPRLTSLERQAKRAREHAQAVGELRNSLREWYGYHWQHVQTELAAAQDNARVQEGKLQSVRLEQVDRDQQTSDYRRKIQARREELNALHHELSGLHSQRETTSRDLAVAQERSRLLENQMLTSDSDLVNLEVQFVQAQQDLQNSSAEVSNFRAEIEEANSQISAVQSELDGLKSRREEIESSISAAQQLVSDLMTNQGQIKALITGNQARISRIQLSLEEDQQNLVSLETSLQELKSGIETAQESAAQAESGFLTSQRLLSAHQEKMEKADVQRQKFVEEQSRKAAELAGLQAQLEVFLQAEALLTGYTPGTRLLLDASRKGKLPGIMGSVNDILEVPPELEVAIAAALGEFIDSVVLDKGVDEALDLLSNEHSRGNLLPLGNLVASQGRRSGTADSDDIIGVGSDLVRCPQHLRPAVEMLLGRVLIVRDRRSARKFLSQPLDGERLVTLSGEVFHASGAIQSSTGDSRPGSTILGRTRQRKETESQAAAAEKQLEKIETRLRAAEKQLEKMKVENEKLVQKREALESDWRARLSEAHQSALAYERGVQKADFLQQLVNGHGIELRQVTEEILAYESEQEKSGQELAVEKHELRSLQVMRGEFSLEDSGARASYWSTQLAMANTRLASASERSEERRQTLDRLSAARQMLGKRRAELAASLEELAAARERLQNQEKQTGEKIKQLQLQIDPAEVELSNLEKDQGTALESESLFRQRMSMAEQMNAQMRINLDRKQEALESLRHRIEDDFGLVAFDYAQEISGPTPLPLEGMVEQLPQVANLSPDLDDLIHRQRLQIRRLGPINPEAQAEYDEVSERHNFLTTQVTDLNKADDDIRQVIKELDELMERDFQKTFYAVAAEFKNIFARLFGGGSARLVLTNPDDISATGIDIEARLPGRRSQGLALLSGGERSLTATALIFSLIRVSPPPFCVLDEVDAMLDELNVGRFREMLNELSHKTQIIIITHNRNTVQVADVIYGVTMGRDSVSQVLSLKLDELGDLVE